MNTDFGNDWNDILAEEFSQGYFLDLQKILKQESRGFDIYPKEQDIFNAFKLAPFADVKAVIIGQDPYHGVGQAHGLSFSVPAGVPFPPSLKNIFKEIKSDLNVEMPTNGDLSYLAKQGVLLLNAALTVRAGQANSHASLGWHIFTNNIIRLLNSRNSPTVFLLWGSFAESKQHYITSNRHLTLKTVHPSPLSAYRGFFGCKHFSLCNDFLEKNGLTPIKWGL
ncbi:MAG: uracil-DNA glycosylase [Defluviitaleaceae bacterium]|nr:uracil-DNA glycosylase [Defluviitaleaceae bacterium]